jgi:hypothetical protein
VNVITLEQFQNDLQSNKKWNNIVEPVKP